MRQRVVIAIALLTDPQLIIADEPTTALDVTIQAEILELLLHLCSEFNMGLISSHTILALFHKLLSECWSCMREE